MSDDVKSLGEEFRKAKFSAHAFADLASISAKCVKSTDNSRKAIPYILYNLFSNLAYDWTERAVPVVEAENLESLARPVISRAIEALSQERLSLDEASKIICDLILIEGEAVKSRNCWIICRRSDLSRAAWQGRIGPRIRDRAPF